MNPEGLSFLHDRLDRHFAALRAVRDAHGSTIPIFALEHGLADADLALLRAEVCSAVRRAELPRDTWLPFIVYAAEIGYGYSGDEYWPTFESRTPSWDTYGDRHYIRRHFRQFSERFGGARPSGAWAEQFSIICWPITHAVLPTDLQRQFARLLFEYRTGLTSDLLRDPAELGKRLAARSWHSSSRFQNFAQNTNLLGQVAAALLVGDDEKSPFLLDSTLKRIVADLSEETESRRWLRDAKFTATNVRMRGLTSGQATSGERSASDKQDRLPSATDPELSLLQETDGWTAYVELPDLSVLAERLPVVHEELGRLRARFAGVSGPPLARGRLLFPGQRLRLDEWPKPGVPLIAVENGSHEVNSLLSYQCALSPGPQWLFSVRQRGVATEVRGKFVRPGRSYVVLSETALTSELPPWIEETACATTGIHAHAVGVPDVLGSNDVLALQSIGLGAITDLELRPAGLVAALWDGEGAAEWIAGDNPTVAVSSTQTVEQCTVTLDDDAYLVPWPAGESEIFLRIDDPGVGRHDLRVALFSAHLGRKLAEGSLSLVIRDPQTRPSTGSPREGLMILTTPVSPSLTELWDRKASLELRGPVEAQVNVDLTLTDRSRKKLAHRRVPVRLPVDNQRWLDLFTNQFRQAAEIRRVYEEAETCLIEVSHPELGTASVRCEREFSPLRWVSGRDSDGPFVRLVDNVEGSDTKLNLYEFAFPDRSNVVQLASDARLRSSLGGLVTAAAGTSRASVILPPLVHDLADLRAMDARPQLSAVPRSTHGVCGLIELAHLWAAAQLPADPFADIRRTRVLRAITGEISGLVGGYRWNRIEQRFAINRILPSIPELRAAVGDLRFLPGLAYELDQRLDFLRSLKPEERAHSLALALRLPDAFAEFLLRLVSEPASLATWSSAELRPAVDLTLESPALVRGARFIVLVLAISPQVDEAERAVGGWVWE